ncbi:hypothetical protein [Streptomyces sp. PTD9-10]|uniref:hypothetical protein n=1 Tax=Streptomyces sp. PTD9-10 TaxID=3120151 RepID=UPI00300820F7
MWSDPWAVVAEADRVQWRYIPLESVGPLHFGMSLKEAVATMEGLGFTSEPVRVGGRFGPHGQSAVEFRTADRPAYQVDVVAYEVDTLGLTCITVDARSGPQVTLDGIRLIGQTPSKLDDELRGHLDTLGLDVVITPEGDVGSGALGILPRAQRAGDVLLTRAVFGRPNDWAYTMFDCIPAEEWDVR